ncbi:MAG: BamA/TamA family outer membrane protein, partial [Phycisphaeraceae bacterium]|nr:BamA/TamA family outer membrane protein [Phycisphaeraceae bacterium]
AGAEIRINPPGPIGLALFADSGQVWARGDDFDSSDIAVAVGPGLTISTPIGAIRGDFAFNLRHAEPNGANRVAPSDWAFHFSIGHPW